MMTLFYLCLGRDAGCKVSDEESTVLSGAYKVSWITYQKKPMTVTTLDQNGNIQHSHASVYQPDGGDLYES